jgi:hypothetical protein
VVVVLAGVGMAGVDLFKGHVLAVLVVIPTGGFFGKGNEKYRLPMCDRVPDLPLRAAVRFALGSHYFEKGEAGRNRTDLEPSGSVHQILPLHLKLLLLHFPITLAGHPDS